MNQELADRQRQPLMVVISGPSGVGKDTVVDRMQERGLPFHFVVTATTRTRRSTEVEGVDYVFLSQADFKGMLEAGEFIEHALVYGEHKGIPRQQVQDALASGIDVVLRVDVQGAKTLRGLYPEALLIYLATSSEAELVDRLKRRRTESPEKLQLRLEAAREEFGYLHLFDFAVINAEGQVEQAVDTILAIIQAEHHRVIPRRISV
ncbi:MAG TPA: guanylate kinase [Anaerolineales bacterium]|nr:guanylate kinase [Anaerolineales bacterium]